MEIGICLARRGGTDDQPRLAAQARGCQHADPVRLDRPLSSIRGLADSPWFAAGWALAALAWLVHVAALSMAPISLVQAVLAGGAVTLAVMSQRIFGDRVERRQWLALRSAAPAWSCSALTLPHFSGSHSGFSLRGDRQLRGRPGAARRGLALGHRSERFAARRGVLLAALAGLLFALAGIAIKAPDRRRRRTRSC